jgi:hypothetical protein
MLLGTNSETDYDCDRLSTTGAMETYKNYWTHIELGAANYAEDGHTKLSQSKTVFSELSSVSAKPNYFDSLPENEDFSYAPGHQYAVLFQTLDRLVEKGGRQGIFHVNDLFVDYTEYATFHLRKYAAEKGYTSVIVEPIPGNYTTLSPQQTLMQYGKDRYDSVHLKNPEVSFYNYGIDGNTMLSNEEFRECARDKLQLLANFSCYGLLFFPIDHHNSFIPKDEYEVYINPGIFYKTTLEWQPVGYYFPEGEHVPNSYGAVYLIESDKTC